MFTFASQLENNRTLLTLKSTKDMTYERFEEEFNNLTASEKIGVYNEYCSESNNGDDAIYEFTKNFFREFFSDPYDAARATFFGHIESWNDEYIRFNAYGNLESLSEYEALHEIEYVLEEIYDCPSAWEMYIDDEEDEEDGEE